MNASNQPTKADLFIPQFSIAGSRPNIEAVLAVEQALNGPTSIDDTLAARNAVHGDFTDDATLSQAIKYQMHHSKNWGELTLVQKGKPWSTSPRKSGRILSGNPDHRDHWAGHSGLRPSGGGAPVNRPNNRKYDAGTLDKSAELWLLGR